MNWQEQDILQSGCIKLEVAMVKRKSGEIEIRRSVRTIGHNTLVSETRTVFEIFTIRSVNIQYEDPLSGNAD
jgi:hypothetical protein